MPTSPIIKRANFYVGWRALGGRLTLTTEQLVFEPHAVDRAFGGRSFVAPLGTIVAITLAQRTVTRPRRTIVVETGDGRQARFLVNGAREFIATLRDAARVAGADPEVAGL